MHKIISLLILTCAATAWGFRSDWKMHPTFDEAVTRVIETPRYVYFTSRQQPYEPGSRYNSREMLSLFRFDKDDDELISLSPDNLLSDNVVSRLSYSPEKGYLAVVNDDLSVDLLYDNGSTDHIRAYRDASVDFDKSVNSLNIDPELDRIYLATDFGYVALNDSRLEVAESRNYGEGVRSMARLGDKILIIAGDRLLAADGKAPRQSLADYMEVDAGDSPEELIQLSGDVVLLLRGGRNVLTRLTLRDGKIDQEYLFSGKFTGVEHNKEGVTVATPRSLTQVSNDGVPGKEIRIPEEYKDATLSSYNLSEIWMGEMRKGLWSLSSSSDGNADVWTLTREPMLPNAPAPFRTSNMAWHPSRGLLVANHGYDPNFEIGDDSGPLLLSGYKNGFWSNLSPVYTNPSAREALSNPNGLAVDPENPDLVYFGSLMNGLERINMSDGSDVLHMSRRNDPGKDLPGFVEIVPDQSGELSAMPGVGVSWKAACSFAAPRFDSYGNMWTAFSDLDDQDPLKIHLYVWPRADRMASKTPADVILPTRVKVPGYMSSNREIVVPLNYGGNKNLLVYTYRKTNGEVVVIDTNGTPTDPDDDRTASINTFVDSDGNTFPVSNMTFLWEDPSTGLVWAGHSSGVFYFNPAQVLAGNARVGRVKVSREDGTNLADYLLDGVRVNGIAVDGAGRKWFASTGAGVVCTSSDGRRLIAEYNKENSPLPDDDVFGLAYLPDSNSLMFSTGKGLVEHFLQGEPGGKDENSVRIYPNPVRPDFGGYITIDGVPSDAVVKIADASGSLVKEIRADFSGVARWDGTNLGFRRVSSGVYFVFASGAGGDDGYSAVGKVLVVN